MLMVKLFKTPKVGKGGPDKVVDGRMELLETIVLSVEEVRALGLTEHM